MCVYIYIYYIYIYIILYHNIQKHHINIYHMVNVLTRTVINCIHITVVASSSIRWETSRGYASRRGLSLPCPLHIQSQLHSVGRFAEELIRLLTDVM